MAQVSFPHQRRCGPSNHTAPLLSLLLATRPSGGRQRTKTENYSFSSIHGKSPQSTERSQLVNINCTEHEKQGLSPQTLSQPGRFFVQIIHQHSPKYCQSLNATVQCVEKPAHISTFLKNQATFSFCWKTGHCFYKDKPKRKIKSTYSPKKLSVR